MSFFSFLKKRNHSTSIVLDIGSGSVGGALLDLSDAEPQILHSIRVPISVIKDKSEKKLLQSTVKAAEEVLKSLIHESHNLHMGKVSSVNLFLSSPWYVSRVHTSHIERPQPVTVTEYFLADVIGKEAQDFSISLKDGEKEFALGSNIVLLEHEIFGVALNGYVVKSPYGKKARQIEVTSYISLISSLLKQKLEEIVYTYVHASHVSFKSFPLALQSFVQSKFPHEENYALFDITALMTDMVIVSENRIVHVEAFAQGKNALIQKVSEAFEVGPDLALSFIHLYAEAKMELSLRDRMEKLIEEVRILWSQEFDALIKNASNIIFPRKVFVTADEGVAKIFLDFLLKNNVIKNENDVIILGREAVSAIVSKKGASIDPFLLVESAHIHSLR